MTQFTKDGRTKRVFVFAFISVLISGTLAIGAAELTIRILVPKSQWTFLDATDDWRLDKDVGWTNRYSYHVESVPNDSGGLVVFETNADGILPATAKRQKEAGVFRIMFFGDSTVLGRAVPESQRIHKRLETLLGNDLKVEVLNAGVLGYSTDQTMLLMKRLAPLYRPDLIFYGICDNDFEGNQLAKDFGNAKPRCTSNADTLINCAAPSSDQSEIQRFAENRLATALQHSALYRYLQPGVFRLRAPFMRTPTAPTTLPLEAYRKDGDFKIPAIDVFWALVVEMQRIAESNRSSFVIYTHPALEEVWEPTIQSLRGHGYPQFDQYWLERTLEVGATKRGVRFCPLIDYFRSRQSRGPFHLLPRDPHCNGSGYSVTAERLSDFIHPSITQSRAKSVE